MNGHMLKNGVLETKFCDERDLWNGLTKPLLSSSKHSSSYKFAFFKAMLDSLTDYQDDYIISFEQIFYRFTEIYWTIVLKYRLRQSTSLTNITYLEQILNAYGGDCYVPFSQLSKPMQKLL